MPRKSLRSQLNQIRAWVRQGRTDAWIAHQLEVPTSELREFVRRHDLTPDGEDTTEIDLRDEIEAEIEAATIAEDEEDEEEDHGDEDEDLDDEDAEDEDRDEDDDGPLDRRSDSDEEGSRRPRRRRRRGGRGRGRGPAKPLEATFDHGDEGYGLWLDPAVADNPVYSEHWQGHRAVIVQIESDRITIRRVDDSE